ncbi:MAG: TIGR03905 family TSCPD domain-containing protein [Bacteroidales bacterium]|nr:TIGR03905 family TSCPD domain-containing protein [Bacteroidales bacterium]
MEQMTYKTFGTCSQFIDIELDGEKIKNVNFIGGCHGNTQGVAALIKGMEVKEAIKRLKGIDCKGKGTSCPDQLAIALEKMITE